jgi:hypothetical protein
MATLACHLCEKLQGVVLDTHHFFKNLALLTPHRDRGSVGSEYFDARLALASRHLRIKDFSSCGNKKMT